MMRTVVFGMVGCVLVATGLVRAGQADDLALRLKVQQERLNDILAMAESDREAIHARYEKDEAQLWDEIERQIGQGVWSAFHPANCRINSACTEFVRMATEEPYGAYGYSAEGPRSVAYNYFAGARPYASDHRHTKLQSALETRYFNRLAIRTWVTNDDLHDYLVAIRDRRCGVSYRKRAPEIRQHAIELLRFIDHVRSRLELLQRNRDGRLATLDRRAEASKQAALQAIAFLNRAPAETHVGRVAVTGSDERGLFCTVEGVDGVLRPGNVIDAPAISGVRVIDVSAEAVRFDKGGAIWMQELGAPAAPQWSGKALALER